MSNEMQIKTIWDIDGFAMAIAKSQAESLSWNWCWRRRRCGISLIADLYIYILNSETNFNGQFMKLHDLNDDNFNWNFPLRFIS